jgi:hypothetical protein
VSPRLDDARPPAKIEIDHLLLARLRVEAAKRDMNVAVLVRELLGAVVADKLIPAILDE